MKKLDFPLLLSLFTFSLIACAGVDLGLRRTFDTLRVYSANPGPANKFYDSSNNEILESNVWVFHPSGTFEAIINTDSQELTLSGNYTGDPTGEVLGIYLEFDGDEDYYEDWVMLSNDNSQILWLHETETIIFTLALEDE